MDTSTNHIQDTFRAAGRRLTSQRRLILAVLRQSDEHLDAEALYMRAKRNDPDISLATVYRTLSVLKEMRLVEEHRLGEEHSHYEAVGDQPHYHFVCMKCGRVIEFEAPELDQVQQALCEKEGVEIVETHLHIGGYCSSCRKDNDGGQNIDEK